MLLEDLMQERFRQLLQSNTGLSAAVQYSRSRPPVNVLPLFDCLSDAQAAELFDRGGGTSGSGARERIAHPSSTSSSSSSSSSSANASLRRRRKRGAGAAQDAPAWRVFYANQHIAAAGSRVSSVIVVAKGAVKMAFPSSAAGDKAHVVVASVGALSPVVCQCAPAVQRCVRAEAALRASTRPRSCMPDPRHTHTPA
jgi:hypothetical protein